MSNFAGDAESQPQNPELGRLYLSFSDLFVFHLKYFDCKFLESSLYKVQDLGNFELMNFQTEWKTITVVEHDKDTVLSLYLYSLLYVFLCQKHTKVNGSLTFTCCSKYLFNSLPAG